MDTLKTAVVVVLLLAVLYGVYVFLNQNEPMSSDIAWPDPSEESADGVDLHIPHAADGTSVDSLGTNSVSPSLPSDASRYGAENEWQPAAQSSQIATGEAGSIPTATEPPIPATPSIAAPDLLASDARSEFGKAGSASGSSAATASPPLPTLGDHSPSLNADAAPDTQSKAVANIADTAPLEERINDLDDRIDNLGAGSVDARSSQPSSAAELSPRYADSVAPIVAPAEEAAATDTAVSGVLQSVKAKIAAGEYHDALWKLSLHYARDQIAASERQEALDLLDPLAGKVIYSNEHLIDRAYQVQGNESLIDIAQRHNVSWQLLANINGVQRPDAVAAGTQLKVVKGPFHADISLSRKELTLYANQLYAGRFTISVGNNPAPQPGEYRVGDRLPGRTFYAGDGQTLPIGDPANPYGRVWIDLGQNIGIHGSGSAAEAGNGCIGLSAADANDLYGILSTGASIVRIQP